MLYAVAGDQTLMSSGYGKAVYELDVPMRNDHRFLIGSNTKLFTAVAVWQLHKAGRLNVYDPVSKYMDSSELGLTGTWCPRAHNASQSGPCQTPQLQHLLRMSGGLLAIDNCDYPGTAWQQQYCMSGPKIGKGFGSLSFFMNSQMGAVTMAEYLKASGVLQMPLEFEPGTGYHYSNPGYTLAGYVVQKITGMPIGEYFQTNMFNRASLSSTNYDVTNGVLGLHNNSLPYPAYISYLTPAPAEITAVAARFTGNSVNLSQFVDVAGQPSLWGGDVRSNKTARIAQANPAGMYAMTAKYPGTSTFDFVQANAAGAIQTTPQDMARWFRAVLVDPDHMGLGKETLQEMLQLNTLVPTTPLDNLTFHFAQGLIVKLDKQHARGLGISHAYYKGSIGGFEAVIYMSLHPDDASKDIFVNSFAATVLPPPSVWPAGNYTKDKATGLCQLHTDAAAVQNGSRGGSTAVATKVPTVLCDLSSMVPSFLTTVPDLLARKAAEAITGQTWFGIRT
eukprot:GHRR01004967.1.p1 GENE.GHRR01004967.1~~GHRR01004967.1.p1  ORF type:complete len:505 (+),score=120.20 GHRR01004967.1:907-2421(+)